MLEALDNVQAGTVPVSDFGKEPAGRDRVIKLCQLVGYATAQRRNQNDSYHDREAGFDPPCKQFGYSRKALSGARWPYILTTRTKHAAIFAQFQRRAVGMKPIDVSIHEPQLHPPPPSGASSIPPAGIVLSQQSGRSLGHAVA